MRESRLSIHNAEEAANQAAHRTVRRAPASRTARTNRTGCCETIYAGPRSHCFPQFRGRSRNSSDAMTWQSISLETARDVPPRNPLIFSFLFFGVVCPEPHPAGIAGLGWGRVAPGPHLCTTVSANTLGVHHGAPHDILWLCRGTSRGPLVMLTRHYHC